MTQYIEIKGARTHNLKNINVKIPKNQLVVITGLSGSGKSSLAFDTIYAEGQRKYVESLSAYARQFLGIMDKPDVDLITGLSPAISIDQKSSGHNPRSTVGTITEIYDYLRLLFARCGHPRSPENGSILQRQTIQKIVDTILDLNKICKSPSVKIVLLAPVVKNRKGTYEELFSRFLAQGYVRARVNGKVFNLEEDIKLDRYSKHNIEIVIDRLVIKPESVNDQDLVKRITDSVELALSLGEQELLTSLNIGETIDKSILKTLNAKSTSDLSAIKSENEDPDTSPWYDVFFSEKYVDTLTGKSYPEIEPHSFSFNTPYGACARCSGLGNIREIDPELIYNPILSISEGGIFPWNKLAEDIESWSMQLINSVAKAEGFDPRANLGSYTPEQLNIVLYGSKDKKYRFNYIRKTDGARNYYEKEFEGVIPNLMRRYNETDSEYIRADIEKYMKESRCPECNGLRLKNTALAVTIHGINIVDVTSMSIEKASKWVKALKNGTVNSVLPKNTTLKTQLHLDPIEPKSDILSQHEIEIGKQIFKELENRLNFLLSVGLDYLTLSRTAKTLSGGESQRIRLASQIGTGLSGVLYVLDEPSIGLHQRDNDRLLKTLVSLKDMDNSVIVVEHDEDTISHADHIIDLGPGAGEHGGEIIAEGTIEDIKANSKSLTGQYISKKKVISKETILKDVNKIVPRYEQVENTLPTDIKLFEVAHHNLKNIDVSIPLGKFVCITGVSGSGKSSLINETLHPILSKHIYKSKTKPGKYASIEGLDNIDKVVNIDQSAIGRTPRSNPATYTGLFTPIRDVFAKTKEARIRGYKSGRFSFNVKGGRCESCKGDGVIKIEMQFLPDVYVKCETCKGQRYNREALQIDYKGKNIADVLEMTVEEASEYFKNVPMIYNKLKTLNDVGLSYIRLGQSATTLSGGEAQRVKLATELSKRSTGKTLYILDEPTTGLHFEDVRKLLIVLHSLVVKGNSVLVIEHNLDVIKTADWIIDLGPEGGDKGGEIIATGTPEDVAKCERSYTGEWLRKITTQ